MVSENVFSYKSKIIFSFQIALKDKVSVGASNKTVSNKSASPSKLSELAAPIVDAVKEKAAPTSDEKASQKSGAASAAKEEKKKSDAKTKSKKSKKSKKETYADNYYVPGAPQYVPNVYDPYQGQYSYQYAAPDSYFDSYTDYEGYETMPYYGPTTVVQPLVTIGQRTDVETTNVVQPQSSMYTEAVELKTQHEPIADQGTALPPGSRIIAEYILGYLENEPDQSYVF